MTGRRGIVVGFRENDPRRGNLVTIRGRTRPAGRCAVCKGWTYVDQSGWDTLKGRADFLMCAWCKDLNNPMEVLEAL